MRFIQVIKFLALAIIITIPAQAAEFEVLERSPFADPRIRVLDLNPIYSNAILGRGAGGAHETVASLAQLQEDWGWVFKGGLSSDGAHTYETLHMPAVTGSFQAGRVIQLKGQIVKGDAEKLRQIIRANNLTNCLSPGYCPFSHVISLDSPGGSFTEALELANIIREMNYVTVVGDGARCESACSLAFFGGYTSYEGRFFPRRFAHANSRLGVHQPSITLPERDYSASEVTQILAVLSKSTNATTQFFLRSGVSIGLMDAMYSTAPNSMHYLSPIEMAGEHILVFDSARRPGGDLPGRLLANRASALAYCGQMFRAAYKVDSDDLVHNLQVDGQRFITFVAGRNFACMGQKSGRGTWAVDVCDDSWCILGDYGQVYIMEKDPSMKYYRQMEEIAVGIDNAELGIAIKDFAHRGALLAYVREYAKDNDYLFKEVALTADQVGIPEAYCGMLDDANPELVQIVQAKLNDIGIIVGRPDGSPGPNTRKGIAAGQERLTGNSNSQGRITVGLLAAMGLSSSEQARFTFCNPAYDQ